MGGKNKPPPPQPSPPPKKVETTKVETPKPIDKPAEKPATLSIGRRVGDCFFVITYLTWASIAFVLFFARCHHLLPEEINDVEFAKPVCEGLQSLEGPLRPFLESHQQWGDKMFSVAKDFTLELVDYVNLLFVAPVGLVLAFGFLLGYNCIKNIALVHSAIMLYNMIITDIYAREVLVKAGLLNLETTALGAFVIYGFLTVFPLIVMKRMWGSAPFSEKPKARRMIIVRFFIFIVKSTLFVWMVLAYVGFYEFSVKHTTSLKHMPSVVDSSVEGWVKSAPHREQLMVHLADFQVQAGHKLVQWGEAAQEYAKELGQKALDMYESYTAGDKAAAPKGGAPAAQKPAAKKEVKKEAKKAPTPPPQAEAPRQAPAETRDEL